LYGVRRYSSPDRFLGGGRRLILSATQRVAQVPHSGQSLTVAVLLTLILAAAAPLTAQFNTAGTLTGTVRAPDGRPIAQALVTVSALGGGGSERTTTTASGTFTVAPIRAGSYEIRVEALGYRPVLARVLTIGGGETRHVELMANPAPPPVLSVDTVSLAAAASSRWRQGGVQLGSNEIDAVPHRFEDLASIASLSTAFDASLGSQGLPGEMTLIIADGIPFYRAPHPTARVEMLPDGLFPRSAVSSVTPLHNAPDIEWAGSAGGYIGVATRSVTAGGGVEIDGAYSGDPTWSSSELALDKPSLLSFQGGARGTIETGDRARLVLSGETLSQQTPLMPRIGETLASDLAGLDPALLSSLTEPGVETYRRYSGLTRFDIQTSPTNSFFFRGSGSFVKRDFENAGPVTLSGAIAPEEESIDFSTALGFVSASSRNVSMQLRAGVSGSYRTFGPSVAGVPPAFLTADGVVLGDTPSSAGKASRTDLVLNPVVVYSPTIGSLKFGATVRASSHTYANSRAALGDFYYSSAASLLGNQGFAQTTAAPQQTFGTQEYGIFAQFETQLSSRLQMQLGGRYDYERIGGDGGTLNTEWAATTGLMTTDYNQSFNQFGARGSLVWTPAPTAGTRVMMTASLQEGDVDTRALYQLFAEDTEGTSRRYSGAGVTWPEGEIPPVSAPSLPSLTLLGPAMRAPRTTNLSLGLIQKLGATTSLFLRGSARRTDFLARRRNLNLPLLPAARDPDGRWVYGTLVRDGAVVTTTADNARRFSNFGDVWALDPDGWSEYRGLTAGLEYIMASVDLYASYTYSETTDNWVGARSGSVEGSLDPLLPPGEDGSPVWSEGVSDFDIPHRAIAAATLRFGRTTLISAYRFESGVPFTPRYRLGVDANGDGSARNDVAFVPDGAQLTTLLAEWTCLDGQTNGFAVRNSCRGPERHTIDLRLKVELGSTGARRVDLVIDAFNLIESRGGLIDDALLLVDPNNSITTSPDGQTVTVPFVVNPGFGTVRYSSSRGRMIRIGVRIGG
jgi:carboxypeptidase family protein